MENKPQIIIIGAGIAGLAAASSLIKHGLENILILEAMARVGGRIHTMRPFGENVIELGANWIHGQKGNPVYTMAKKHRLLSDEGTCSKKCLSASVTKHDYFFNEKGEIIPNKTADDVYDYFKEVVDEAVDEKSDSQFSFSSVGDYLDKEFSSSVFAGSDGASAVFEWCKRAECLDVACTSMYECALWQPGSYIDLEGEYFNCLGPGGYQAILDILMKNIPSETIICSKPVHCIHWESSSKPTSSSFSQPVKVVCADGDEFIADHIVITVSLGYLKKESMKMFDPTLPEEKLNAIERLSFGTVNKIFLEFEERFWPTDCEGIQLVWEKGFEHKEIYDILKNTEEWKKEWYKKLCGFETVSCHDNVLCGWIAGREAEYMEELSEEEVGNVCVRLLRDFTGWKVTNLRKVLRSGWHVNPYVLGSYSYIPIGVDAVREQEILAKPLPFTDGSTNVKPLQVLFAGEATHTNYYTTTHGAYLSGTREAKRLLNLYKQSKPH
ncbi:spermine oxidase-like [Protopterus annectens]|uniref:spermine oxidase-like n=1 Tax=Protopterus annectens TaxID=7888 RepID=UPI001CFBADE4|nr:spermine oxidase-like [Protopterus annectens]XP_043916513.1 spermine oxidase-like [Protopterus annectens]XP_043916515.1 spermine oxidase-like [Protopterus annectens]XP_043916516.1 spermine oxidase-like [Protopterus annectens]XP_043916517.1 spermine oxidase-like [Protopterus annectens]